MVYSYLPISGCQSPELNGLYRVMWEVSIVTVFWDRSVMLCVEPISDSVSLNDNLVQSKLWVLAAAEHFNIDVGIKECRYWVFGQISQMD